MTDELSRIARVEEKYENIKDSLRRNDIDHSRIETKVDKLTEVADTLHEAHSELRGFIQGIKTLLNFTVSIILAICGILVWIFEHIYIQSHRGPPG